MDISTNPSQEQVPSVIDIYIEDVDEKSFSKIIKFLSRFYEDYISLLENHKMYGYEENFDIDSATFIALTNTNGCEFCLHKQNYIKSHTTSGTCTRFIRIKNDRGVVCFNEYSDHPRDTCLIVLSPSSN